MQYLNQANERRDGGLISGLRRVLAVRWPRLVFSLALLVCVWPEVPAALSQRRPVLRNTRREYLAGSFALFPDNARLHSLALPKQLAALADHELLTPPPGLLDNPAQLRRWISNFDFSLTDGVLLALDNWLDNAPEPTATALLKSVRAARPNLPLYAYVSVKQAAAFDLVEAGLLDFLLVNTGAAADAAQQQTWLDQITQRHLQERVAFNDSAETAALLLQTRLLNQRFGFAPKAAVFSSAQLNQPLRQKLGAQLLALGANVVQNNAPGAPGTDLLLFIHTPQTAPAALTAFVNALVKATQDGFRCALLDLSNQPQSQEALLTQLRQRKLLDHLAGYAAASGEQNASQASSRALAQAMTWIVALKFLRDPDVERLRRIERAQVGLLLSSYLRDWIYPAAIQPRLATFIREQSPQTPEQLTELERAESFALAQLKPRAEELFNEQFLRNVHAVLLATGERAEYEVKLLQGLQVHLTPGELGEPDIRLLAYLAHQGNFLPQPATPRPFWELNNAESLDVRLADRFEAVNWQVFKTDAAEVFVSIQVKANAQANPESYTLRSRRAGNTRRIEISAATAQGAFYALGKLEQLGADGLLAQDVNLTEAPELAQRGVVERCAGAAWSQRERQELLRLLGGVRMNRYVYATPFDAKRRERWREAYTKEELAHLSELARVARENFVTLGYALNPAASLSYASEEDFAALTAKLKLLASLGISDLTLSFTDAPLQLQQADQAQFKTLAAAQANLLRRVDDFLKTVCPACQLSAVPANLIDPAGRQAYLQELGANVPARVNFVWLGSESFLPAYASAQAQEWLKLTGRRPLLWDNLTLRENATLPLSFSAKRATALSLAQEVSGFLAIPPGLAYAARLPLVTAADYAWSSRSYNPARALESALNLVFDERSRAGARVWAQTFGGAAETNGQTHEQRRTLFDPLFKAKQPEINLPLLEQQIEILQNALSVIGSTRERGLLRGELAATLPRLRAAVERVKTDGAYERQSNGSYRLRAP